MTMMDFNANNSYRLSICVDKSVFTTIETAQCDVQFYLVNSLLSKCLGTFTLGPPVMSGGATPGNPISFGGHPSGLMGLLSHAGVAGSNPAAVAAASGLQQGQQVNMVPRRGHPAGRARPRNTYSSRKRTITLKRQKPPPSVEQQRPQSGIGVGITNSQVTPSDFNPSQYSTASNSDNNQVSSILSQSHRGLVNIISDDDDFEIQEINSKESPKVKPQQQSSATSYKTTDLSKTSSSHCESKMPRLDLRVRSHQDATSCQSSTVGIQGIRASLDENLADNDPDVETMTTVGQILDAVQGTHDLSSFFIKTQPEDEFVPDRVVSLNGISPVRPLQSLLNHSSLSNINESQLGSNDTKRDISNSSQTSFLVESSSLATSRSSNSISSIQGLSTLFQDRPNEVKTECNEAAGSCQVTQKRDPQSAVTAANLVSPSVENVLPVFDDAEQRNSGGHTTLPIEDVESEDPEITDVIPPSSSSCDVINTSEATRNSNTNPLSSSSSQQSSNNNSGGNTKTLSCEICDYKTTSVKRMRLHYNYAHGAEVDEEKLT